MPALNEESNFSDEMEDQKGEPLDNGEDEEVKEQNQGDIEVKSINLHQ